MTDRGADFEIKLAAALSFLTPQSLGMLASGDESGDGGGTFNNGGTVRVLNGTEISSNSATGESGSGGAIAAVDGFTSQARNTFVQNQPNDFS